jgi:transposase
MAEIFLQVARLYSLHYAMARRRPPDPKLTALRERGTLNPKAGSVRDPLFATELFFDARDLVQVKYEMVRQVRVDKKSISNSARAFGFSRPAFYQADAALERGGLAALIPRKPGPRRAHKLSDAIVDVLVQVRGADDSLRTPDLVRLVQQRFGVSVHPRSITRALRRREKKRP